MRLQPLWTALPVLSVAALGHSAPPQFTVAVFNYAGASDTVMTRAVETASREFRSAGVESRWVVCAPQGCGQELPGAGLLQLFLMPRMRAAAADAVGGHPAGFAIVDKRSFCGRGYAFYDAVTEVADRTFRPVYIVLAGILVHESGHLLGLKHQAHGIMRPNLEAEDMDNAIRGRAFSPQEQKLLRLALDHPAAGARYASSAMVVQPPAIRTTSAAGDRPPAH